MPGQGIHSNFRILKVENMRHHLVFGEGEGIGKIILSGIMRMFPLDVSPGCFGPERTRGCLLSRAGGLGPAALGSTTLGREAPAQCGTVSRIFVICSLPVMETSDPLTSHLNLERTVLASIILGNAVVHAIPENCPALGGWSNSTI